MLETEYFSYAENVQNLYVNLPRKYSNGLKAQVATYEAIRRDSVPMPSVLIISVCYKHFLFLPPFWTDLAISCSWAECLIKQVMPLEPVGMLE